MADTFEKLNNGSLSRICAQLDLPEAVRALIAGCTEVPEALVKLEGNGFLIEAVRLVAHGLPKREATWWACMCARHTATPDLPEADRAAVDAAERWVRHQHDEPRRAALAAAKQAGFASPEAWAGVAAFWSGDSMSPLGQPPVAPAEHLTGVAVAGAVALAAVRAHPERQKQRLARFLEAAHGIAAGGAGRLAPEDA